MRTDETDNASAAEPDSHKKVASRIADTLGHVPSPATIPDAATYFYIKEVKKWMECPVCGAKLLFDEDGEQWVCEECSFVLPEQEFLDGYVFWFCDRCKEFLNSQDGFDPDMDTWKCTVCGQVNDISEANLTGICMECGELLDNPNATLCKDCEVERLEQMGAALKKAASDIDSLKHYRE